ncbi:transcriptional regulator NanR [Oricola thermophila]|uniref:Transcriptional regulator NanR n=1 Tax=Oricola thermophila TaxID=2742145 RepID=A0A6N1VGX1_9HYPH|nr:transcriptional regulator NanR [Oricola thermophila]QKV18532.1 transcriptional regulator NanR [Oricola thermophila]
MQRWNDPGKKGEKIVRRKLSDQVLERLRDMMISGELKAGDPMPSERELMERFGVGRPAVREALQSMQSMGLITISHGERSRVGFLSADILFRQADPVAQLLLAMSPDNLEHLKEARRHFELGMVRLAAERATPEDAAVLRGLVEEQRGHLGDAPLFIRTDMQFHATIARMSGNPIFASVSEAMLNWLFNYHTEVLIWTGQEEVTLKEHALIVDNIEAGDPDGATEAMRMHIDRTADLYKHRKPGVAQKG